MNEKNMKKQYHCVNSQYQWIAKILLFVTLEPSYS
jgi:hypothetical protein